MRIYLMTDMEGVAGVQNFEQWVESDSVYYPLARKLLTHEVNATVEGLFAGGATTILVADGHGAGGIDIVDLDPRVELLRGWGQGWPLGLEEGNFDAVAWVGQHARSRTPFSNMAHTQSCQVLELSVNNTAIGELGQLAMCASQLGVRSIFAAGEQALAEEAQTLIPGIETAWVKRGNKPGRGDECTYEEYVRRNGSAIHMHPVQARRLIRDGAERAVRRAKTEDFGIIPLKPPFRKVLTLRATQDQPFRFQIDEHPDDICVLMGMRHDRLQPIESDEQLREMLVD